MKHLHFRFLVLAVGICVSVVGFTQAAFVGTGRIEYEKKINMHKYMEDNSWTRELKDKLPVYSTSYYNLIFDSSKSIYKAGKENPDNKWANMWGEAGDAENVIQMDFMEQKYTEWKQVFEKKYLISDSMLSITWRITDETRTIAGFDCRKAVGKLYDSLYVVAFYTDQILLPAGPEQYHGLPGTILGLAFPRYYTTWFATKVELTAPAPAELKLPSGKAASINRKGLMALIKDVYNWGTEAEKQKYFWDMIL